MGNLDIYLQPNEFFNFNKKFVREKAFEITEGLETEKEGKEGEEAEEKVKPKPKKRRRKRRKWSLLLDGDKHEGKSLPSLS